jgi:hypothetical protein
LTVSQKKAIGTRIKRILANSATTNDIAHILSDLRFAYHYPKDVRDLGDFAAHRAERDQGKLLTHTDGLFKQLRTHLQGKTGLDVRPAYTDVTIADSILSYCQSFGIFRCPKSYDTSPLAILVGLYGLAVMHGCVLREMDGSKETALTIGYSGNTLQIGCTAPAAGYPIQHAQVSQIFLNLPVFVTSLPVSRAIIKSTPHFCYRGDQVSFL